LLAPVAQQIGLQRRGALGVVVGAHSLRLEDRHLFEVLVVPLGDDGHAFAGVLVEVVVDDLAEQVAVPLRHEVRGRDVGADLLPWAWRRAGAAPPAARRARPARAGGAPPALRGPAPAPARRGGGGAGGPPPPPASRLAGHRPPGPPRGRARFIRKAASSFFRF